MERMIAAVASSLSFLGYLIDNNRVKFIGFAWLRFSKFERRSSRTRPSVAGAARVSNFESRVSKLPVSIFRAPDSAIGEKETNGLFRPTAIYPQHNKGPAAEYFVRPKMAHLIENTGVVD